MISNQQCPVQKGVKIICPHCGAIVIVPMCQAVNGQTILCPACKQEFVFREQDSLKNPEKIVQLN
jgi:predicted RNA-binding Zn-ribbon protein involved in translation (DUF1610 family)